MANLILDEFMGSELDKQTGILTSGKTKAGTTRKNTEYCSVQAGLSDIITNDTIGDSGGASRFFYCAKASRSERGEANTHPTVKPIALMRYLVKLVTKKGGLVLDPYNGSGSTGVAASLEGMSYVGIELNELDCEISRKRIGQPTPGKLSEYLQQTLF